MKIIITESKLYQVVIDYLNERYDINNIHWTYGLDDWGNEVDYAMAFYEGDYEDDDNLFMWYGDDYWYSDEMSHHNKEMIDKWKEQSPTLSFNVFVFKIIFEVSLISGIEIVTRSLFK